MASQLTDDLILSHRLIERRYVQIPKDQKALLDDNAWSETLSRGQHPMLNVPASVLQDVKDVHTRKHAKPTPQATSSARRPSTADTAGFPSRSSSQEAPASSPDHNNDEQVPWSSSPVHHFRARYELQIPSSNSRQSSSPSNSPRKSRTAPQLVNDEPQSSGVNSVGLEIEPPGFVPQVTEPPVNRTALRLIATASAKPEPTPPSAQLPTGTVERVNGQPLAKRRRVTENVHFTGHDSTPSEAVAAIRPSQQPDNSNQNSLTTTTSISNPSLNTQSTRGNRHKPSEPKVMSDPAPVRSFTPTFEGRQRARAAQHLVITETPISGPSFAPPPAERTTLAKAPSHTPKPPQRPLQHSQASSSTTYEMFRLAYPDYSRSSRDFVIALLSVKQLRRERALHEFLFDDFIRAYSSDYFAYVSECSRKQIDKILPGIQWYNENVQDVLYTKKIVRKNNLTAFLDFHIEEAHSIRRALGDSQSTESAAEDSDENIEDALDEDEENEPEVIELDRETECQASPELHIKSPEVVTDSPQLRSQTSLEINKLSGSADAEQGDKQTQGLGSEENVQESHAQAVTPRRSPELRVQSPGSAKFTAPLRVYDAPQARNSATPLSVKSFASQEISRDNWSPSLPSSAGTSRLMTSLDRALTQTQTAPVESLPQHLASSVASRGSRTALAGDEDSDDENAFEPPMPPPTRPTGIPASSKRSSVVLADRNADDNGASNSESPMPLPQSAADPSSTSKSRGSLVDTKHDEDASAQSKPPMQRGTPLLSPSKPRNTSAEEDEADSLEVPMSPLPQVLEPSSTSRPKGSQLGKKDGTEEGDNDAVEARPPPKSTQSIPARGPTPRPSPVAARLMPTSTMPAPKSSALCQGSVTGPQRSQARVSKASSVILGAGRHHSAGSSIASSADGRHSKKRLSETPEQRSLRLKAFMQEQMEKKKRLSSKTPESSFTSRG